MNGTIAINKYSKHSHVIEVLFNTKLYMIVYKWPVINDMKNGDLSPLLLIDYCTSKNPILNINTVHMNNLPPDDG